MSADQPQPVAGEPAIDTAPDATASPAVESPPSPVEAPGSTTEDPPAVAIPVVADEPLTGVPASTGDPGDASLLGLIDRLAVLLERSELSELEVRVGGTGLVLRRPSALPAAAAVAPVASPAADVAWA